MGPWGCSGRFHRGTQWGPGRGGLEAQEGKARQLCVLAERCATWGASTRPREAPRAASQRTVGQRWGLRAHTGPRRSCSRGPPGPPSNPSLSPGSPELPLPGAGPTPGSQLSRGNSDSVRVTDSTPAPPWAPGPLGKSLSAPGSGSSVLRPH